VNISTFIEDLRDAIELENSIKVTAETPLADIPGWDSLAILSTMAMASTVYEKIIVMDDIERCRSVGDLFDTLRVR
jgi:acyl carrier protein